MKILKKAALIMALAIAFSAGTVSEKILNTQEKSVSATSSGIAYTSEDNFTFTYDTDYMTATLTKYKGTAKIVNIPPTIMNDKYRVTTIAVDAFYNNDSITQVIIPDTVTSIGNYAFKSCDSLSKVVLPEGLKTIGNDAFRFCPSLTEMTIPSTVTGIGSSAIPVENNDFTLYYVSEANENIILQYLNNYNAKPPVFTGEVSPGSYNVYFDPDKDGQITAADALAILQKVVASEN